MGSVYSRLRRVRVAKQRRLQKRKRSRGVPLWFTFLICGLILFSTGGTYFVVKNDLSSYSLTGVNRPEKAVTVPVDGYNVTLLPPNHNLVEGSVIGVDVSSYNHRFYLQNNLTRTQMRGSCVHEKLHDLGMPGGSSDGHDWIYLHEDSITDYTCTMFIRELEKRDWWG